VTSVREPQGLLTAAPAGSLELLQRIAASPQFQKSKRLRDLLLYLGEHSLRDPNCTLREQEIGVEVFERQPDYDTSHDTLVRVQVSQLRKKLQDFFESDGRDEPLIVDIPKGSYVPVFRPRVGASPKTEPQRSVPVTISRRPLLMGVGLGLLIAGLTWGIAAAARSQPRGAFQPVVEAFWRQLLANGQSTYVVLSDVTLIEFEKLMGRPVPLPEYETHEFDRLAGLYISDPVQRALAREFVNRVTTSISDVQVARDLSVLAARQSLPLNVLSARDMSSSLVGSQNTILLGSRRANPWIGLFEDRMTFQTDYEEALPTPTMRFVNRSPLAGEPTAFQVEWRRGGYCRVAYLPNPNHTGSVLLISGSDVISTEAGGRYATSEESLRQLRQKLGLKAGDSLPYFEVLLRTQVVNNTVPWSEMVAYRPHRP
jgi:hypothetical protein